MRISILFHSCCLLGIIATACLAAETDASKSEIELIRQAIAEKGADWMAGESWVTGLSPQERANLCGSALEPPDLSRAKVISLPQAEELPSHFDWRKNGADWVTPPRNQGNCGSCWDFAAVAQVEAWWKIVNDRPDSMIDLSEQFILSCAEAGSCDGGDSELALQFVRTTGVPLETCLRYQANDAVPCSRACSHWADEAVRIPGCGYVTLEEANIANIKNALLRQPLAASYIVYDDFFSYSTGVYEHVQGEVAGGHAIIIIGWDDEKECWICKNSWGTNWGETADFKAQSGGNGGYFRIKWGECGIGKSCLYIYDNLTGPALTTTPKQFDLQVTAGDSLQELFTLHNLGQEPLEYWTTSWGGASFFHVDSFMAFDSLSWWCGMPQIGGYQNGWLQFLDTPPLDLSGTNAPQLNWMGYWALEDTAGIAGYAPYDGWDGCNVWISTDGGRTFTVAEPLQPRYTSRNLWSFGGWWYMGAGIPGWGGSNGGWQEIQHDLSPYKRDSVVVRFAFAADGGLATADDPQLHGFFIDEIAVSDGETILFENHGDEKNGMTASGELQAPADWLRTVDTAGRLAAGESATAQLLISARDLQPGNYLGRLIILSNDTTADKYFLPLKLRVRQAAHDICVRQEQTIPAQIPLFLPLRPAVTIQNQGSVDESTIKLVCHAQVAEKMVYSDTRSITSLPAGSTQTIVFAPFSINELGRATLTIAIADAPEDDNHYNDKVVSSFDITNEIDDFEAETGYWHFGAGWAIDEDYARASLRAARLTEAPALDGCLTFLPGLDLSHTQAATLKFWTRYVTEQDKDVCYVEASHDSLVWIKLDSLSGTQWPRWAQRQVSLGAFVGGDERTWFRFHYVSDTATTMRGVIIDDVEIYADFPDDLPLVQKKALPKEYSLTQNYPNPFNDGTTIEFALPKSSFVTLSVYNLRGEQVAVLMAEQRQAGVHQFNWEAGGIASGVYLYRLQAGDFSQSRKLILMR